MEDNHNINDSYLQLKELDLSGSLSVSVYEKVVLSVELCAVREIAIIRTSVFQVYQINQYSLARKMSPLIVISVTILRL